MLLSYARLFEAAERLSTVFVSGHGLLYRHS